MYWISFTKINISHLSKESSASNWKRFHTCPPFTSPLCQINPIHALLADFLKTVLLFSFHLSFGLTSSSFPSLFPQKSWFLHQNSVCNSKLSNKCQARRPSVSWFEHLNKVWWEVKTMKLSSMQYFLSENLTKYTGRFIMFSVITNIYNKKTKGPTLMALFTATGKLETFIFWTTIAVRCVHRGWHGTHRYDIQVLATHASTWEHRYSSLLQWSVPLGQRGHVAMLLCVLCT